MGYMSSMWSSVVGDDVDGGTLLDAVVELLLADPNDFNGEGLARLVCRSLRVRGWLDAVDGRIAGRAAELAAAGSGESAGVVLAGGGRAPAVMLRRLPGVAPCVRRCRWSARRSLRG